MGERRQNIVVAVAVLVAALALICGVVFVATALFGIQLVPVP
jgi:hypothetical protein